MGRRLSPFLRQGLLFSPPLACVLLSPSSYLLRSATCLDLCALSVDPRADSCALPRIGDYGWKSLFVPNNMFS